MNELVRCPTCGHEEAVDSKDEAWQRFTANFNARRAKAKEHAAAVDAELAQARAREAALRGANEQVCSLVNHRLAEPGDKDETEILVRIGTICEAALSAAPTGDVRERVAEALCKIAGTHMTDPDQREAALRNVDCLLAVVAKGGAT